MAISTLQTAESNEEPTRLLGDSPSINQLRRDIDIAARSDSKVLITGETGAGKEVVARLIHDLSKRRRFPFVTLNCAAVPDSLLESELFGHARGSFTDAYSDREGVAALANRGTLFLDEIGEMSPRMQAVLLRFTETQEIHRVGSDRSQTRVDTRIVAATNRQLPDRIASGDFRQDLYYRLNVIHLLAPPLRERGSDVLLLFQHYVDEFARTNKTESPSITPEARQLLLLHQWPGNVRELKNVVERLVVRCGAGPIGVESLPLEIQRCASPRAAATSPLRTPASPTSGLLGWSARYPAADAAWNEMLVNGKSFWTSVHALFIDRELTKTDLRQIIRRGLEQTQGSYRKLVDLFNMLPTDYKRFLAFLYQHDCHLAFHPFREPRESADVKVARGGR
jgi:DNA-binding NtrC family response regulator